MKKFQLTWVFLFLAWALPAKAVEPTKEWTFLLFLNAHNNLEGFDVLNLNQLENIGSGPNVNLVAQWAANSASKTHRLRLEKDGDSAKVTSQLIESMPIADMGDYKSLIEFANWGIKNYPAKHYFIAIWNHGSGWKDRDAFFSLPFMPPPGISFDDKSGNYITTAQLGLALKEISKTAGKKIDILGNDACLMAMAEVATEVADSVDYFLGSEELAPGLGWPYHKIAEFLASAPTPEAMSKHLVAEYKTYLAAAGNQVTFSAFQLDQTKQLIDSVNVVADKIAAMPKSEMGKLQKAISNAQAFYYEDYVDLYDFLDVLHNQKVSTLAGNEITALKESIGRYVIANGVTSQYARAAGVAVWIPKLSSQFSDHSANYKKLRFGKETRWLGAVEHALVAPKCEPMTNGQFASSVVDVSSQYSTLSWGAKQALGNCDTFKYGDSTTAWAPQDQENPKGEHIAVGFSTPVFATGAVIREVNNNGFVSKIETIDESGIFATVWEGEDPTLGGVAADFEVKFPTTTTKIAGLRVSIDTERLPGWEEIDSIQLIGTP